jgi:excinuclease ABC subunit A
VRQPGAAAVEQGRPGFVRVRGAREHNLQSVDVDIPRDALVVFTGVSGSGKSSLAFGTLYAEAQRRYLESVAPYARRLFHQVGAPAVDAIDGLPPAVALQQQRGAPTTRSSVGSVTTLSNLLRMLYSRAGDYPPGQPLLYAESFSANTAEGRCPACHGLGRVYDATERSMVRDDALSIRQGAVAAWPGAWQGQNLRDIVTSLGIDIDTPWRELPRKDRDWLLFTDDQPQVPVWPHASLAEVWRAKKRKQPHDYLGTFTGARRYVLHTFATTQSAMMKRRVARSWWAATARRAAASGCGPEPLSVTFAGRDIAELSREPLDRLAGLFRRWPPERGRRRPPTRSRRRRPGGSPPTSPPAWPCCSTSASATSPWSGPPPPCPPASCSGCGWRRRCTATCSGWCTCWTSRPPACTRPTPRRCYGRWTG